MNYKSPANIHICASPECDCGFTRRDFMRLSALASATVAAPFLFAGDAYAQQFKGDDVPVKIGYLPITDATPLLVAHARKLFEAEGLQTEVPRLFRNWAQIVEAFVSGQINVIHLLSPATLWVRYGTKFPAKIVAWNHVNGSALTVANAINTVNDLGGKTVAVPFWYSIHNVLLQQLLRANGLTVVTRARDAEIKSNEVNLIILPPAEMVAALAGNSIAGYIVAEPFNAAAESKGVGKILRFSGDLWQNHACCVTFLSERDITERPEWAQRVTNAIVKAQLWVRSNQQQTANLLSAEGANHYTPHSSALLSEVLINTGYDKYEASGVVKHKAWHERRIDFQPYPFASYTEELVRALRQTKLEGENNFIETLDPAFVARDLVDDSFVRKAILAVGGPATFGLSADFTRREVISL